MEIKKTVEFNITLNRAELELLGDALESIINMYRSRDLDKELEKAQDIMLIINEALNA